MSFIPFRQCWRNGLYGSEVQIEEIRYYDDGTLEYTYTIRQNPWLSGGLGRSGIDAEIYVGEEVCRGNGGLFASNSLFYKKGREWIYDVPPEADRIIFFLGYEKEIEVSLTEGRVRANERKKQIVRNISDCVDGFAVFVARGAIT